MSDVRRGAVLRVTSSRIEWNGMHEWGSVGKGHRRKEDAHPESVEVVCYLHRPRSPWDDSRTGVEKKPQRVAD